MIDEDFITAPLRLLTSDVLFCGQGTGPGPVITDLDEAMTLANDHDLPPQYRIWSDVQMQAEAAFSLSEQRLAADAILDPLLAEFDTRAKPVRLELRKAKMRKTLTPFEEFVSVLIGDVSMQLKLVGVARACLTPQGSAVFEAMHASFAAGFYPCGWHVDAGLISFDPRQLEGHRPNPFHCDTE